MATGGPNLVHEMQLNCPSKEARMSIFLPNRCHHSYAHRQEMEVHGKDIPAAFPPYILPPESRGKCSKRKPRHNLLKPTQIRVQPCFCPTYISFSSSSPSYQKHILPKKDMLAKQTSSSLQHSPPEIRVVSWDDPSPSTLYPRRQSDSAANRLQYQMG